MSIVDRFLGKFGYSKKGVGPLIDDSRIYRSLRSLLASSDSLEVEEPYQKSVWVFASVNAIAQNISRVPFYIYTEKNKDVKKVIQTGPLYDLFMNPNPFMISSTLFFATVLFMELYGECFWLFEDRENVTEIPSEIWCVSPTRFEPVIDKNKMFRGYWKYEVGDFKTIFAPHQILQFKYFNPYDEIRGLSPIEASKSGVEQDFFANKYNKQFFKDGASLSGIIRAPDFLTDDQFNRLRNQFEERHSGYSNAHKVGIIEGGADFLETKAMSQRDMEFATLKTVIRGEILAAFKTNEVVLGNYENIQSYEGIANAHASFWKETLLPKIIYLEDFLWAKFFSKIDGGKYWGGFDTSVIEALREDFGAKVEMAKTLVEMGYPINAINRRLDLGFEDFEWGNTWWVKVGVVPVESIMNGEVSSPTSPTTPTEEPNEEPDEEPEEEPEESPPEDEPIEPDEGKTIVDISKRDDALWSAFIARQVPLEDIFKNKIKRFLFGQRKRVLTDIYQDNYSFNFDSEVKLLSNLLIPIYDLAKDAGVELLKEELSFDSVNDSEIESFIMDRVKFSSHTITKTILKQIENALTEENLEVRAEKIKKIYNRTNNRIETIARTESCAIINGIRFTLMKNSGITYHKWICKSEKGRHDKLNGKVVRIGESFDDSITLRYPNDRLAPISNVINCRCLTVPVIKTK